MPIRRLPPRPSPSDPDPFSRLVAPATPSPPHHPSPPRQYCQIAVNARYICYGLRAGQIRVLHKDTATRALLRGHAQQIADMRFSPSKRDDVLASFSVEGNLFVKRIVSSGDDIEERPIAHVAIRDPADPSDPSAAPPRVHWISRTVVVASSRDAVFLLAVDPKAKSAPETVDLDLSSGASGDLSGGSEGRVRILAPAAGKSPVVAVDVAPGGAAFAAAHADGAVRVWRLISPGDDAEPDDSPLPRFEQTSTFTAFEDVAASSVFWTGDGTLVVGGAENRELATWSLGDSDMVGAEETQRLSFAPAEDTYCVAKCAYPSANIVLLSNLRKNVVYAAHLASSGEGFDYVAEFSATMPVLSFAVAAEDGGEDVDATAGTALQLYCMQTQAIQQYALHLDRCRPETARGNDESALVAEEDESDEEDADAEDEDEDATVAIPAGAGAGVKTPAPAPAPAEKTPSKLLSPTELMRVASGAKDVEPTADKPAPEKPPAPAKLPPAPKSAPPPPRSPPPPGPHHPPPPPPHHHHPHHPPPPPHHHLEASLAGLRESIYNDLAGFVAAQQEAREAAERERQKQLLVAVSAAITRDLPVQIEKLLKRELKSLAPVVAAEIKKASGGQGTGGDEKAMARALPAALEKAMSSVVVPKFEAATAEMFDQVRGTFERGMDDLATELYTQKENAVAAEVGPLVTSLRGAAAEVRVAAEVLLASGAEGQGSGGGGGGSLAGGPSGGAPSLAELESAMDPTVELGRMVEAGDLEGAFTKALGMSSVETVAWTCGAAEDQREAAFGGSAPALSQGVLLSLAQQLSSDLEDDAPLKLAWIRDSCLAVDPSDPQLAAHVRPILEVVMSGLHECAGKAETPAGVKADLKLCVHVVNSLLTACK